MDLKKIFGVILTLLGIVILVYSAFVMLRGGGNFFGTAIDAWSAIIPTILGLIFFGTGVSLIKRYG